MKTIGDLKNFVKKNARLSYLDYGDRESYQGDYNRIRRAQRECKKSFWFNRENEPLKEGSYYGGRLIIEKESITYIAGQYAQTEVWWALADYLTNHNEV